MKKITDTSLIHLVQDKQGGVFLAVKEKVFWVDLDGNPLVMVEDLGTPKEVVVKKNRLRHCLGLLVKNIAPGFNQLIALTREILDSDK